MMNDLALVPFLTASARVSFRIAPACAHGEPPFRMTARFQAEPPMRIPASPHPRNAANAATPKPAWPSKIGCTTCHIR